MKKKDVRKKIKGKVINAAQKIPNESRFFKIVGKNKVIIQIPKKEMEDDLFSVLTIAMMFGLQEMGINNLDITVRGEKDGCEIVLEK